MGKKLKIAVTGGIGSGKSVVCNILEKKGYPIIRADVLGKDLLKNDPEVKVEIIREFGEEAYKDNEPNKTFIAEQVFNDQQKLALINSIIHPRTIEIIESRMTEFLQSSDMVFVESALIYEANREEIFDYVLLVYADDEYKIFRIVERDNVSVENIRKRIENQIPDSKKKDWADFTIENNGSLKDLEIRTEFIITILKNL